MYIDYSAREWVYVDYRHRDRKGNQILRKKVKGREEMRWGRGCPPGLGGGGSGLGGDGGLSGGSDTGHPLSLLH